MVALACRPKVANKPSVASASMLWFADSSSASSTTCSPTAKCTLPCHVIQPVFGLALIAT